MQFCKEYNAATQDKAGTIIPVEITVYEVGGVDMIVWHLLQHSLCMALGTTIAAWNA